ncbi:pectate lyase [Uliginosibacterium sp. 31-12]|uniref:pectate lyase n=1 Tax=Uliginosibacterium sp. 31-12 TaxID=3062781 RepID=UPI0026E1290E|nr:pectate lyase [Uliginosibacterium sp. 31-12]MDO6384766.1 pectate lyase [Uliginosibacterium sp. 31-12]
MHLIRRTSFIILSSLFISASLAQTPVSNNAPPTGSAPARAGSVLKTVALIMGEPNYSIDGGYEELEEGLYSQPELLPGERMLAPLNAIILGLGGEAELDPAQQTARFTLNGKTLLLKAGQTTVRVGNSDVQADIAPQWRNANLWVSAHWVFDQFGAYSKWDKTRQRYTASLILPAGNKVAGVAKGGPVVESNLDKQDAAFWASAEGRKVAGVIIGYQNADGGWPKLERDASLTVPVNRAALSGFKAKSTIDNDATTKQLKALAAAYRSHPDEVIRASIDRGLDYLLSAQQPSGGWQQYWPAPQGYKSHITFNDNAMANVLEVLRDVAQLRDDFAFVSPVQAKRASVAYDTGLALILRTQIRIGSKRTGWCAQYDVENLQPAMGRAFELPSISGGESVNVVRFLMSVEKPAPEIVQAVQDAVAWLDSAKLSGLKRARREDRTLEYGFDFVMEKGNSDDVTWARFYDLQQGKPLFSARDSKPRSRFEEVSYERRVKYNWFTTEAAPLLKQEYPAWVQRNGLKSVLTKRN